MCSTINGLSHRMLQYFTISISHNLTSTTYDDNDPKWCTTLAFIARLLSFVAVLIALAVIMILMIAKFLCQVSNEDRTREGVGEITETNPLIRPEKKVLPVTYYGTCVEENIETGNCSNSSSNSSCSEDLYDGKVCVICYDELRHCFFVPCGHCATCYVCAQRIFYGESKTCPVCRRLIRKVRKLFTT